MNRALDWWLDWFLAFDEPVSFKLYLRVVSALLLAQIVAAAVLIGGLFAVAMILAPF
jgi:hypothetical protein